MMARIGALLFIVALALATAAQGRSAGIIFTKVPVAGAGDKSRGNIEGKVQNVKEPEKYRIVLYAHTDHWYVQPLTSSIYTRVHEDGKWSNWTHLGDRYAALLVRSDFPAPSVTDALPDIGGDVLAAEEVAAIEKSR